MGTKLDKETISKVLEFCSEHLVPDKNFLRFAKFDPSVWFSDYFIFVEDKSLRQQLGEAYYQARFLYKLIVALGLTASKKTAIIKFQVIQYVSIYEALIDYTLSTHHSDSEAYQRITSTFELRKVTAFSKSISLLFDTGNGQISLTPCKEAKVNLKLKEVRFQHKLEALVELNIITQPIADKVLHLYDVRNNVHLTTAAINKHIPDMKESTDAFNLMEQFVGKIRSHLQKRKKKAANKT